MTPSDREFSQLQSAIAALEAQRTALGDAVVDAALGPMREKLAALQAQVNPADQQRKQATVLFADVSGFTALSETMDAEVVAGVMNDLWALVDAAITEHGGRIDKHIGDAVMALWGVETAREDDPERAVRAALAMQAAVGAFCTTHHLPLAMRVGVNTGPVVLGVVATTGEFTAMGDAVNLASRLEDAAPVGGILIGHDTYRQVRGIFDVLPQAPLVVKGKAEPVLTYVVRRAKPRAFRMATRGVEGVETRMVGREAELDTLKNAYLDTMESRETRVAIIVGEAGVGKSRLLYEFNNWIELRPETIWYFKSRATQNTQNVPYSLFRDLFANRFEILESDPIAVALDKFRRGMAVALEPDLADTVGYWLGFDFSSSEAVQLLLGGSGLMETARAFLMRYFRALATNEPTVIFLEDMHWADDPSLDLATYLAIMLPEARLLLVAVTRPSLFERRPNWGEGQAAFRRVPLTPLSKRSSRALVDEILKRVDEVPDSLRDLITDAAEGNPFYIEELVRMLIEQGVIERGITNDELRMTNEEGEAHATDHSPLTTDHWRVRTDKLAALRVPPTLTALLQARLDGLPRPEREALQRASVIGRLFWDDAVADLLEVERESAGVTLEAVRRRELIFRREHSAFAGTGEYIFKHALLRDVAYETVLLKRRAAYHGRAARWLEEHAGERLSEYMTLIAEHYIQADQIDRAVDHLMSAGQRELDNVNAVAARPHFERALGLLEANGTKDDPRFLALRLGLSRAYTMLSDYAPAERLLTGVVDETRRSGNFEQQAEVMQGLAGISLDQGDFVTARTFLDEALPLARINGGRILLDLLASYSWLDLNTEGRLESAEVTNNEMLALARTHGRPQYEALAFYRMAQISNLRRQPERAFKQLEQALILVRQQGNLWQEGAFTGGLGWLHLWYGDLVSAVKSYESSILTWRELGYKWGISNDLCNLALAYTRLGDDATARSHLHQSLILAVEIGAKELIDWNLVCHGMLEAAAGRLEQALALIGLAASHSSTTEFAVSLTDVLDSLGVSGDAAEAGMAAGAALDFETVVQEILDGKW